MTAIQDELAKVIEPLFKKIDKLSLKIDQIENKNKKLLTTREAARYLGVCEKTMRSYAKNGKYNFVRNGSHMKFKVSDLENK